MPHKKGVKHQFDKTNVKQFNCRFSQIELGYASTPADSGVELKKRVSFEVTVVNSLQKHITILRVKHNIKYTEQV